MLNGVKFRHEQIEFVRSARIAGSVGVVAGDFVVVGQRVIGGQSEDGCKGGVGRQIHAVQVVICCVGGTVVARLDGDVAAVDAGVGVVRARKDLDFEC